MKAHHYLKRYLVGQEQLKPELAVLMEEMKEERNLNLMFRGPSGHGKTHTANLVCSYLGLENCHLFLGDELFDFNGERRVNVLDEVHEVKTPEYMYRFMDADEFVFLVCTNEFGDLKEPLVNRCIVFDLREYTLDELAMLVKQVFFHHKMDVELIQCRMIASYARGNPRVAKILAKRSSMLFRRIGKPGNLSELIEFLKLYFDLDHGGFTHYDRQYLDFLKLNKRASLATLSKVLCIPEGTLLNEIEPFLLKQHLVEITARGRIYIGVN